VIDDNTIVPGCILPELEKPKYSVSEEALLKGALPLANVKLTVALAFTGVTGPAVCALVLVSVADTDLTELGIPVKRKLIVSETLIVLLHVLLPNALFDMTTEFVAEVKPLVNAVKLVGLITA